MQSDREQLRHSINHPHGLVFDTPESKDAKIPFGFIFGIRAGQDIDCIVGGFNLPLDTMIDILQYLPIVEILKARKISKYFNYAASIYLSKLNDAFFHIGVLSDCYVFSNFYKKCKLENGVFLKSENGVFPKPEKTTNFEKEILIDFSNICFDTSQDEPFVEFLVGNSKANQIEDVPMPTTDNKKRKDLNSVTSVNSVNTINSRDGKNIFSQNLKNQTSNSIISYVRKGHLSKYCRENHAHLCYDCAAKYKQNICKHIHCPAEYHRACTGDINCEYRCYRCDHTDNTDQTEPITEAITEDNSLKSNDNSPVKSKNSADLPDNRKLQRHGSQTQIDPSGQQVPKNQVQFVNYAGNNSASNTVNNTANHSKNAVTGSGETGSASRFRHAQGGASFNFHSMHSMQSVHSMHNVHSPRSLYGEEFEPEDDYRVLPLINTEDRMEFGYCMIDRMPRDIVKCDRNDCRRDILISFRPNLSVQYLENHLLVRRRILGEEICRENASGFISATKFELTVPDIIKNYEKNNGCITWHDLGIIQRLIKSLNNQVELDYWQQEICRNYQEFKISSMDSVEFAFLEHPSIFSEELHPIQCLHDSGHCEENHDEDWQCAFVGGDTYRNN